MYTREQIEKAVKSKKYLWFNSNKDYDVNIVGIRNSNTGNKVTNVFDDFLTISFRIGNEWQFYCWNATTEPGKKGMLEGKAKGGVARLVPSQYRGVWEIDKHQGKYDALCQKGPVKVYRDNNMDDEYDLIEENVHEGIFGINIHKAGKFVNGSTQIDKWSAGCQVFSKESDFNEFMDVCRKARDIWGNSFTYTLIESNDIS